MPEVKNFFSLHDFRPKNHKPRTTEKLTGRKKTPSPRPQTHRERSQRSPRPGRHDRDLDDRNRTNAQELKHTLHSWAKSAKKQISESRIGLTIFSLNNTLPRPFLEQACVFYNATTCNQWLHHKCIICSLLKYHINTCNLLYVSRKLDITNANITIPDMLANF